METKNAREAYGKSITISGFDQQIEGGLSTQAQSQGEENQPAGRILLKDFDIEENEHFVKYVFIPYFKDIYKDLSERSDKKAKGINRVVFLEVTLQPLKFEQYVNLPGIISERFFKIVDENNDEYIDQKEFMRAMFKVYYSQLESKFKLIFDMQGDFDKDGLISQEDIHLVLSHVPIEHISKSSQVNEEGSYTKEGGGYENFEARIQSQKEIFEYLTEIFKKHGKAQMNLDEFTKLNTDETSESFLSIMILLHDKLPCSDNFFRYFKNYDRYMDEKSKLQSTTGRKDSNKSQEEDKNQLPIGGNSPKNLQVRSIESPKFGLGLSPIHRFMQSHSPGSLSPSFRNQTRLNIDTQSQKAMLKYAANTLKTSGGLAPGEQAKGEAPMQNYLQDNSPRSIVKKIPIQQFKQSNFVNKDGKLIEQKMDEQQEVQEESKAGEDEKSPTNFQEALRLPNISLKPSGGGVSPSNVNKRKDGFASPSHFLSKEEKDDFSNHIFDNLKSDNQDVPCNQLEGELMRKASEGKLKRYQYCLLGKELYCYKKKDDEKHKDMHSLIGVFVKSDKDEQLDANTTVYPFKLIFPMAKVRVYYCKTKEERNKWIASIKLAIGYSQVEDFYEILGDLGKGKFGQVKLGLHIKTKTKVAIKVIKKKNMNLKELELQKREIEVLKICQHPNVIRLLDVFENPDYIYIVLEHCAGGDLFHYLDKRDFKVTEDLARHIAHQIAAAIFYLHSYGIAHRDLKLENILMTDSTDQAHLKLVDFGLSRMVGPNETSNDPFGTLSYVAPEVLMQRPYGKNVDLWSLGVIIYVLLSGMLPFDSDDNKETARQTIYDPVPFDHSCWNEVSKDAKDIIIKLLEKDRFKRIPLEDVLQHSWICKEDKNTQMLRQQTEGFEKFERFAQTQPKSPTAGP